MLKIQKLLYLVLIFAFLIQCTSNQSILKDKYRNKKNYEKNISQNDKDKVKRTNDKKFKEFQKNVNNFFSNISNGLKKSTSNIARSINPIIKNTGKFFTNSTKAIGKQFNKFTAFLTSKKNKKIISKFTYNIQKTAEQGFNGIKTTSSNFIKSIQGLINNINIYIKNPTITVGCDNQYFNTTDTKLANKIIADFLNKNNYKKINYIALPKKEIISRLKKKTINIGITNFNNENSSTFYTSPPIFSKAIYFLIQPEISSKFNYPLSLYQQQIGLIKDSDEEKYMRKNFIIGKNYHFYSDINNMIDDFKARRLKIILLNRKDFYKNVITLPSIILFFIEYDSPYGLVLFSNKNLSYKFDVFFNNRKYNTYHEWVDYIYKKPQKLKYLDVLFKKFLNKK